MIFLRPNTKKILSSILFILLFCNSYGIVVVDLYNISLPVEQENQRIDQNLLLQKGLQTLLTKLSAQDNFENNEVINKALQDPKKYLQEYSTVKNSDGIKFLKQGYNKNSIDTLMQEAKLPTWGVSRPLVMVWLTVEQPFGERVVISESEESSEFLESIKSSIKNYSETRAIPIALPFYDLDERSQLSVKSLWSFDLKEVQSLSEKYRPDEIVLGKIYLDNDKWHIDWLFKDKEYNYTSEKKDILKELTSSFSNVASAIANEYAIGLNNKVEDQNLNAFYLTVDNVKNLNSLTKLTDYLKNIKSISSFSLKELKGREVVFKINLKTDQDLFTREVKLENKLVSNSNNIESNSHNEFKTLSYKWQL